MGFSSVYGPIASTPVSFTPSPAPRSPWNGNCSAAPPVYVEDHIRFGWAGPRPTFRAAGIADGDEIDVPINAEPDAAGRMNAHRGSTDPASRPAPGTSPSAPRLPPRPGPVERVGPLAGLNLGEACPTPRPRGAGDRGAGGTLQRHDRQRGGGDAGNRSLRPCRARTSAWSPGRSRTRSGSGDQEAFAPGSEVLPGCAALDVGV
jgi:hypothetical protein